MTDPSLEKRAILVLGMHRSGTSLLTGLIANAGFSIGQSVMPPAEDNPKGFFENQRIVDFNERLLNELGCGWSSWQQLPGEWVSILQPSLTEKAIKLVEEEFDDSVDICIKDPRICRLLPFWRSALDAAGYELFVVFTTRQLDEVSASLRARDGMGIAQANALWLRYNLDAMRSIEESKGIHISYESVLKDPHGALSSVSALTGADLRAPDDNFVDHALKHHVSSNVPDWADLVLESCHRFPEKPDPLLEKLVFPLIAELADQEQGALAQSFEGSSREPNSAKEAALFNQAEEAKQHAISLSRELETGRKYITDLERAHQLKDEVIQQQESALQQTTLKADSHAKSLALSFEEAQKYAQSLEETIERKDSELRAASEAFELDAVEKDKYSQSLLDELEKKEREIVKAQTDLKQLHQNLMDKTRELEKELQRFRLQRKMIDMFKREDNV